MTPEPSLVGRLADALADRWTAGDRVPAEHFFDRHPHLWADPPAALELIAEELAARDRHGPPTTADELAVRFPRWAAQVRALVACQQALGGPPPLPEPGDTLGEFELVAELGRGGHGRVYLATQPQLGGRPVVLKVGPDSGGEHLSLARLQHTHIVPLYSAHEFPGRGLRGLCLPHFGGRTLDAILKLKPASGADLLAAVGPTPTAGVAAGFLQRASLADAVCWVGACLADALQYAHERGLLHLDVKPSNVLLAADGTPMLLDFHLARPPLSAGEPAGAWVGGTPGHMAPEQDAAVSAVRQNRSIPLPVDARADVFALGQLLREFADALGGRLTVGVRDILGRCTAADPGGRYPTAGDVAADLRRHLADRPLRGVRNRSLAERWRKWRRRQPLGLPAAAAAAGLLAVGGVVVGHFERLAGRAQADLVEADRLVRADRPADAVERLKSAAAVADGLPLHVGLRSEVQNARTAAERAAAADELHAVAERVRWLAAAEAVAPGQAEALAKLAAGVWDRRDGLARLLAGQPTADREERWRADLFDVGVLSDPARRADAERLLGPRAATPRAAWDWLVVGRERLAAGDPDAAGEAFDRAVELDPRQVWANHYRGAVLLKRGRPVEAAAAFAACVALAPEVGWCWHNRGLAFQAAGQPAAAEADFARAKALP